MKIYLYLKNMVIIACFLCIMSGCINSNTDNELPLAEKPNIIFIMADDMGYGEAGCYGQKIIKTPNIDKIAAEGMKFTQFYAGSAVCAPSRCVLMTGKHTGHSYIRNNGQPIEKNPITPFPGQNPIPDSVLTIGEILQQNGYVTAAIGKWGLGNTGTSGDPNKQGFDLFYGFKCQVHAHNHYPEFLWRNDTMEKLAGNDRTLYGAQHSQDMMTKEALNFIDENKNSPFFLYLPFIIPHLAIQTTDPFLEMYRNSLTESEYKHRGYIQHPFPHAAYAGMITQMDDGIGQIMNKIKKLGLDKNTIIIFTSDNGPTYGRLGGADSDFFNSSGPLNGRKGSLLEGGIREPLVVSWPGKIKAGTVTDLPSAFWDVLPTLCEISGSEIPENTDGISFLPTLLEEKKQKKHETLYWEFPAYGGQAAMISGDWKLLVQNLISKNKPVTIQLFNLKVDVGEQNDLSKEEPKIVKELLYKMNKSHIHSDLFNFPQLEEFYIQSSENL